MLPRIVERVSSYSSTAKLMRQLIDIWPEHATFIEKSWVGHNNADHILLERLSHNIITLAEDHLTQFLESYRWLCGVFYEEQIYFMRHKKYRCTSFSEVNESVYTNKEFMQKYMEGLLVSQLFWQNHAKSYIFHSHFVDSLKPGYRYLEIGPGHGLYLATIANKSGCVLAEAWDVSAESLLQTKSSLQRLHVTRPVKLEQRDVHVVNRDQVTEEFDVIVICEVLEHLEKPEMVLANLKSFLSPGGKVLINVPINSPAPDHIFLLESMSDVVKLIEASGLKVEAAEGFPATGYTLERAMSIRATVSCAIIAAN